MRVFGPAKLFSYCVETDPAAFQQIRVFLSTAGLWGVCVCSDSELEAAPLSASCIVPPRAYDSALVTQGDTWRGSPLPAAYGGDRRPVTVCHSAFVPRPAPTLAGRGREGRGG